jgi:mRNA interferase MazF
MSVRRGDIVIVDLPYAGGGGGKVRPALVIQNDTDNQRLANAIVAMISGNIRHAHEPTQLLIDPSTPDGSSSGLNGPSVVKCINIYTIRQCDVIRTIGTISAPLMPKLDTCLKCALGLS